LAAMGIGIVEDALEQFFVENDRHICPLLCSWNVEWGFLQSQTDGLDRFKFSG
jgi:hypothetical protein